MGFRRIPQGVSVPHACRSLKNKANCWSSCEQHSKPTGYDIDWPVFSIDNLKTSTDYNDETPTYYNYDDYGTTFIMDGDDIVGDR